MATIDLCYRNHAFKFERTDDDSSGRLIGRLLLDGCQREMLTGLQQAQEAENDSWYLDDDGLRLPPDKLFAASPWQYVGPSGTVKLLCRWLNLTDGSAVFDVPESYFGQLWDYVYESKADRLTHPAPTPDAQSESN